MTKLEAGNIFEDGMMRTADHVKDLRAGAHTASGIELGPGHVYRCTKRPSTRAGGVDEFLWQHVDPAHEDPTVPSVSGCRKDALVAVGKQLNLNMDKLSSDGTLGTCFEGGDHPLLRSVGGERDDGGLYQFRRDSSAVPPYPVYIPGNLKCTAPGMMTSTSHRIVQEDAFGADRGLVMITLAPEPQAPRQPAHAAAAHAPRGQGGDVGGGARPAGGAGATSLRGGSGWMECAFPTAPSGLACAKDAHCPLTVAQAANAMLQHQSADAKADSVGAFLASWKRNVDDNLPLMDGRRSLDGKVTPAQLKNELQRLMRDEPTFHSSVNAILHENGMYTGERLCNAGVCPADSAKVFVPKKHHPLYTGHNEVTFHKDAASDMVTYSIGGGAPQVAHARVCLDGDAECDDVPHIGPGVQTLRQEPKSAYRANFPGDDRDFLVYNAIMGTTPSECAQRLCAHHSEACPASVCSRGGNGHCTAK